MTYTPYIQRRKNTELFSQRIAQLYHDNLTLHDVWAAFNFSSQLGLEDFEKLITSTATAGVLEMTNSNNESVLQIVAQHGALRDLVSVMRVKPLTQSECNTVRNWARAAGNTFFLQSTDQEEQKFVMRGFSFPN